MELMGIIRRCRKCGVVINHLENNPGGMCDKCDGKVGHAYQYERSSPDKYWPNGGTFPPFDYNRITYNPYFTRLSTKPYEDAHTCWKCKRSYPNILVGAGEWGLCAKCWGEIKNIVRILAVFFIGSVTHYIMTKGFHYTTGHWIPDVMLAGLLGVALVGTAFILLAALFVAILLLSDFIQWVSGWVSAIGRLVRDAHAIYKQKIYEDAVKRAELAEPTHLDGAALDALLTEEYKKKQGWQ